MGPRRGNLQRKGTEVISSRKKTFSIRNTDKSISTNLFSISINLVLNFATGTEGMKRDCTNAEMPKCGNRLLHLSVSRQISSQ